MTTAKNPRGSRKAPDAATTPDAVVGDTQCAVQITAKNRLVVNPEMPVPPVGPTQLLLQIEACGICFSDTKLMHAFEAHPRKSPILGGLSEEELAEIPTYRPGADPIVPGHEPVARVAKVGEQVSRFHPGQRVLVQTDYRHLPTAASNGALGYDFDGGLQQYALVDERMVVDPSSGESYLIEVGDSATSSAIALIEPWACVETAYAWAERQTVAPGGRLLVVVDAGFEPEGLDEAVAGAGQRVDASAEDLPDGIFDDIVYVGADAAKVEALSSRLAKHGLMNIVTCGRAFDRPVGIDVGRIHYDLIRYCGTRGDRVGDGYAWIPPSCELRPMDKVAVIGAAGPMGLMHAVRAASAPISGVQLDAVDVDDDRLGRLQQVLEPIADSHDVVTRVVNSTRTPLVPGSYSYVALMVPSPDLLCQAVELAGRRAIINAFAGFAVGTVAPVDLNGLLHRRVYLVGTSGSRVSDMETVWRRVESGELDTNISLDAICGMAGVPDAIASVDTRTSQGKIVVYPGLPDLGLIRLGDLPWRLPEVAAAMEGGRWTKQAEELLLGS